MRHRLTWVQVIFVGCLIFSIFRVVQLQLFSKNQLSRLVQRQHWQKVNYFGRRGVISDRKGRAFAVSLNTKSLYVHPNLLKNISKTAKVLSKITGRDYASVKKHLLKYRKKKFLWIERILPEKKLQRLKKYNLNEFDIGTVSEYRRDYPMDKTAASVVGFVSIDGEGLAGVERKYNKLLASKTNHIWVGRDAKGRSFIKDAKNVSLQLTHTNEITLTIDADIQYYAEQILAESIKKHKAKGGQVVVLQSNNGDVLAMANSPSFLPGDRTKNLNIVRNRIISDPIEPGSVIKPLIIAQALDQGHIDLNTRIDAGQGEITIGKKTIREANRKYKFNTHIPEDIIRYSSNVAMVNLQKKIGFSTIWNLFENLGFLQKTSIGLLGESKGIVRMPHKNDPLGRATMSFGQGMAVTPMQIAMAYMAIANEGFLQKPNIVKSYKIYTPNGWRVIQTKPHSKERVFSKKTALAVSKMLQRNIDIEGGIVAARVSGVSVAGKTGTSQKVDYKNGGYKKGAYLASFAGYAPAKNPQYIVYVMIDEPQGSQYYGNQVAAPVFSKLTSHLLRNTLVPQTVISPKLVRDILNNPKRIVAANKEFTVPRLTGMKTTEALKRLVTVRSNVKIIGQGSRVVKQSPKPGKKISDDNGIEIHLK